MHVNEDALSVTPLPISLDSIERTRVVDLDNEEPLSLYQASRYLPDKPSHPTVYRYATRGISGVVLETLQLGKQRFTSKSAIQRFLDRLAANTARNACPLQ